MFLCAISLHEVERARTGISRAAEVVDRSGRLVVYRAWQGAATRDANGLLMAAAAFLKQAGTKPTYITSKRGTFAQYYFTLHKDNQLRPRMSKYFCDHVGAAHELGRQLVPVVRLVADVFRRVFPQLYEYYSRTLDFALGDDSALESLFYPFASFALNVGDVVCSRHLDCTNLGPGLCCIVPFGTFDPSEDCRIGVAELGCEVEVGPGVPIWLPSAAFTHYNTPLMTEGATRGSAVFWTGGTMFQHRELGGRMVSELAPDELLLYRSGRAQRIADGIARFPMRSVE
ncbi:uncharacterized protein B0H18DRAFT_877739 [Fomitopsis serialis]|uniref:uncharacterized protein n=1 Tax=Fomitopsis serialis TaxID=139415 RepID=UPI00200834F4|nr:uncharacterized protein B0H18DRAFT_877739 [Neoantrodia serialis]KAH9924809.1 hypothetical protein B0H18DRAFT_877739 [Neoantrodia serialis]